MARLACYCLQSGAYSCCVRCPYWKLCSNKMSSRYKVMQTFHVVIARSHVSDGKIAKETLAGAALAVFPTMHNSSLSLASQLNRYVCKLTATLWRVYFTTFHKCAQGVIFLLRPVRFTKSYKRLHCLPPCVCPMQMYADCPDVACWSHVAPNYLVLNQNLLLTLLWLCDDYHYFWGSCHSKKNELNIINKTAVHNKNQQHQTVNSHS